MTIREESCYLKVGEKPEVHSMEKKKTFLNDSYTLFYDTSSLGKQNSTHFC